MPAAKAELYLVRPDGTPFANQTVTLRGGVYLEDNYCGEDVRMGPDSNSLVPGNTDGTYQTDGEGKLTVHMDATQFNADGYTGPLTNAALDYWFELRDLNGNQYYPVLVNVQGSMSADRILRTGSAVVVLEEVPDGEENKPYLVLRRGGWLRRAASAQRAGFHRQGGPQQHLQIRRAHQLLHPVGRG